MVAPVDRASWSRGWAYTLSYFRVYPVLVLCALAGATGWFALNRRDRNDPRLDVILLAFLQGLLLLGAVIRTGADDRFALLVPVTAGLYLVAEEAVRVTGRRALVMALGTLVLALTLAARVHGDS